MSFREFTKELNGNRVEGELIKTSFYSLMTIFIFLGFLYVFRFRFIEDFMSKYGFFLFFASLSYALLTPAVRQLRAYKEFPCMSGMMIGMAMGMMAGFLSGFYIGATNGMFWGSVFGMSIGVILGTWLGSCCGPMGFMEGIMAGFMGGLMGAMTSVMMINDNIRAATMIIFGVSAVILIGLNYLMYKEMKENERQKEEDYFIVIFISFILIATTVWLMIFGPRSTLFG